MRRAGEIKEPKLLDKFEIPGTVWRGEIVSLWDIDVDIQVLVEWSSETMSWGTGGDTGSRKLFNLSDLTFNKSTQSWVEKSRVK